MKFFAKKLNKGTTLVEILFYLSIFALVSLVIVESSIILTRSFRATKVNIELAEAGSIMERITREIKQSGGIYSISPTSLKLNKADASQAFASSIQFELNGTDILLSEDGNPVGNLNPSNIKVNSLLFEKITTNVGLAVRVTMQVSSTHFNSTKVVTYTDTAVLRGSY